MASTQASGEAITTRAAVLHEPGPDATFSVEDVTLDAPQGPQVRVKVAAAGLCHSDEHLRAGDYALGWSPVIGGHEGSGVVTEVGPDVKSVAPGDHVVFTFIPSCGRCDMCVSGHQNLCDRGAHLFSQSTFFDDSNPFHQGDVPIGVFVQLGTFTEYTVVHEDSVVKIDEDIPLEKAALVGCGVVTGWGSATTAAGTQMGETCVVIGCGGVGINAVQGFAAAGAANVIACDTEEWKGMEAVEKFGATHAAKSMEEAADIVSGLTNGQMADRVVLTVGVATGDMVEPAMKLLGRRGVLVFTAVAHAEARDAKIDLFTITHYEQQLRGALYGSCNPRTKIPQMLAEYRRGVVNLDDLITNTYTLDQVNDGYADMLGGKNYRGVILFDD